MSEMLSTRANVGSGPVSDYLTNQACELNPWGGNDFRVARQLFRGALALHTSCESADYLRRLHFAGGMYTCLKQ